MKKLLIFLLKNKNFKNNKFLIDIFNLQMIFDLLCQEEGLMLKYILL